MMNDTEYILSLEGQREQLRQALESDVRGFDVMRRIISEERSAQSKLDDIRSALINQRSETVAVLQEGRGMNTIIEEIARERARYRASNTTRPTVVVLDRQNYSRLMDSETPGMIFGLRPRVDMNLSEPTIIIHGQEDES